MLSVFAFLGFIWLLMSMWVRRGQYRRAALRRRLEKLLEKIQEAAHAELALGERARRLQEELNQLEAQTQHQQGSPWRAFVIGVLLPLLSWGIDFYFLAPVTDFILNLVGVFNETPLWARIGVAFMWALVGYTIGFLVWREDGVTDLVGQLLAAGYVCVTPLLAFWVYAHEAGLPGVAPWVFAIMGFVGSLLPVYAARESDAAKVLLGKTCKQRRYRRVLAQTECRRDQLGRQAVQLFYRYHRLQNTCQQQFPDEALPPPQLDPATLTVIENYSCHTSRPVKFDVQHREVAFGPSSDVGGDGQVSTRDAGRLPASEALPWDYRRNLTPSDDQLTSLEDRFTVRLP